MDGIDEELRLLAMEGLISPGMVTMRSYNDEISAWKCLKVRIIPGS